MIKQVSKRSSGVLCPVFSLPGPGGIGTFSEQARQFGLTLLEAGFSSWQVLPFTPTGYGNSPYQGYSAFAGNKLFISPAGLYEKGLLTKKELVQAESASNTGPIDYPSLQAERELLLRQAFSRLDESQKRDVTAYAEKEKAWLLDYALFRVIKKHQKGLPWWLWTDQKLGQAEPAALAVMREQNANELAFWYFVEYEFNRQWLELKDWLNRAGLAVIGDMPIYVAADSSDVWAGKEYFAVDADGQFSQVAGVPPDYFSADGQLWGNPLYNWSAMAKDQYSWWIRRIEAHMLYFDQLRIDHFRGFVSYWAVPAGEKTARNGQWLKGPGLELFNQIKKELPDAAIIAEDLGDIDDEVRLFLKKTGLPGMKVMQFSFDPAGNEDSRVHQFKRHSVAYSGTHDNMPLAAWLEEADPATRQYIKDYCGSASWRAVLRSLWQSNAEQIIVPVQDLLGLGSEGRINTPGTLGGNWTVRFSASQIEAIDTGFYYRLNEVFGRLPKKVKRKKETFRQQEMKQEPGSNQ